MAIAEATLAPCSLCGQPIDYGFTRAYPRHSLAGTVHHWIGLAQGGDPTDPANLTVAHQGCNSREGNRMQQIRKTAAMRPRNSRRW
jgi:5-methylcytosine-specific restriction endonuclease McrA